MVLLPIVKTKSIAWIRGCVEGACCEATSLRSHRLQHQCQQEDGHPHAPRICQRATPSTKCGAPASRVVHRVLMELFLEVYGHHNQLTILLSHGMGCILPRCELSVALKPTVLSPHPPCPERRGTHLETAVCILFYPGFVLTDVQLILDHHKRGRDTAPRSAESTRIG